MDYYKQKYWKYKFKYLTLQKGGQKEAVPKKNKFYSNFDLVADFKNGEQIPEKYTCKGGDNLPPLTWSNPPEGTKSFALIIDDPDAMQVAGEVWDHLVVWNIPGSSNGLNDLSLYKIGKNSWGRNAYGGPCPPDGKGAHRYFFKLYALDTELNLPTTSGKEELKEAMKGHIMGKARLIGKY